MCDNQDHLLFAEAIVTADASLTVWHAVHFIFARVTNIFAGSRHAVFQVATHGWFGCRDVNCL